MKCLECGQEIDNSSTGYLLGADQTDVFQFHTACLEKLEIEQAKELGEWFDED